MTTAVRALPLLQWASRFREGTVELTGRLPSALSLTVGERVISLAAGPLCGRVDFLGGSPPSLLGAAIDASVIDVDGEGGVTLAVAGDEALLDGRSVGAVRIEWLLDQLLDHVHDMSVQVAAWPGQDLLVKLSGGVEATVRATDVVTLRGRTVGPPDAPVLDAPLVCTVGGAGLRVSHQKMRWLASLARVRIQEASLHPDGKVDLQADTRVGIHRMGRGLDRVSERLSQVVRRSPRFARVRAFLRTLD